MSQKSERVLEGAVATCPTAGKGLKKTKAAFIRYTTGAGVGKEDFGGGSKNVWKGNRRGRGMVKISEGRKGPGMPN